jgi:hypothetical protein
MRCVSGAFEAWNGSISRDGNSQASADVTPLFAEKANVPVVGLWMRIKRHG